MDVNVAIEANMPCRVISDLPFLVRATSNLYAASHGLVFIARPVFEEGRGIERASHAHAQVAIAAQLQRGGKQQKVLAPPSRIVFAQN